MAIPKAKYKVGDRVQFEDMHGEVIERTYIKASDSWREEGMWQYEVKVSHPTYHTVFEDEMYE